MSRTLGFPARMQMLCCSTFMAGARRDTYAHISLAGTRVASWNNRCPLSFHSLSPTIRLAGVDCWRIEHLHKWMTHRIDGETNAGWRVVVGVVYVMFGSVITAEAALVSKPSRPLSSLTLSKHSTFLCHWNDPRDSHAYIFLDSQHAAVVHFGSFRARINVRLAGICQHLLLQVQQRVSLTLRHIHSH